MTRIAFVLLVAALVAGCGGGSRGTNPSGTLETTEVDLASVLSGRVLQVRPRLGDHVKSGDTLVVLDTDLLHLQREQNSTNRQSNEAQQLVGTDALRQAKRNLDLAESTLTRIKALFAQGSATQQQVDEAQTKRDVAADAVSSAQHQIDLLRSQRNALDDLIALNDRQIKDGVIVSPLGGTVILRNSEPGEIASPGSVLLRVANLDTLELRVYLAETDLAKVKIGQQLPVLVDALKGQTLNGTVTWISSEAEFTPKNAQTRQARTQLVYAIKLSVPNPSGNLHIGMPAEVKL
ncbi:MAG TPA: efflux RND transporter periplasmic adaptor subunit [bacterium]